LSEIGRIFLLTFAFVFINPVNLERAMFGRVINPVGQQVLTSLGLGVAGGFVVSAVLLFLGLSLEHIGLYFIWPVALLLLLFNPRFLCFSYAGGIVAAAALLARFISGKFPHLARNALLAGLVEINIPALLVLIALLHLLEAVLIYFSGHRGSSPIYLKKPGGQVVGGFSLQRFWPLPLTALLVTVVLPSEAVGVSMPEWWGGPLSSPPSSRAWERSSSMPLSPWPPASATPTWPSLPRPGKSRFIRPGCWLYTALPCCG